MKYYFINSVKHSRPEFNDWSGFLVYAVAPALGFSTMENIGQSNKAVRRVGKVREVVPLRRDVAAAANEKQQNGEL